MGKLQSKLNEMKPISEFPDIKHAQENRPEEEIEITNRLAFLLSDVNINRVNKHENKYYIESQDWSDYIFLCFHGFPVEKTEFDFLKLPGQKKYFKPISFNKKYDEQQEKEKIQNMNKSTFQNESQRVHQFFQSIPKDKKIILVYHSFGSYILAMYYLFKGSSIFSRIKGMVQISGSPLRYYLTAANLTPFILNSSFEQLFQEGDKIHSFFLKAMKQLGFDLNFEDKYQTLSFMRYVKSKNYGELFEMARHYPKIVKLFVYGRKDTIFQTVLLNEKSIFYTYKNKPETNQEKIAEKYVKLFQNQKGKNIQEKFIFAIPKGQHSLHTQEKDQKTIRNAVREYLFLIHE